MNVQLYGKNIEITDALRNYVEQRLTKLDRFFENSIGAQVALSVQKERQTIEVTIPVDGGLLRAEETDASMYTAVDLVLDKLERQMRKYKARHRKTRHTGVKPWSEEVPTEEEEADSDEVVREKRFTLKPMTLEEAKMQLNLLGHDFFVYRDASSEGVNVLYRRRNGGYGLIVPE